MTYSFRLRFRLAPAVRINVEAEKWRVSPTGAQHHVALVAPRGGPIKDAEHLVLRGDGYATESAARTDGERFRDALILALSRNRVGADFGDRAAKGTFTDHGLAWLEGQTGHRILNDEHGLMTFASDPPPRFAGMNAEMFVGRNGPKFEESFRLAYERADPVSEKVRVAFDIYGASFFATRPDARLILLMMALEVLLDQSARDAMTCAHLDELVSATESSPKLSASERGSLANALRQLKQESIRKAGQRLITSRLGSRSYMGLGATKFFGACYTLRSNMVHGVVPAPSNDEVGRHAAELENMVGDLLAGPLLDLISV